MKKNFNRVLVLIAICLVAFSHFQHSQSIYKINDPKDINLNLSGTSSLHNWAMNTSTFAGEAQFDFKPGNYNQLTILKSSIFSLVVLDLKSDEKGLDKNAYKALKTDRYKDIFFCPPGIFSSTQHNIERLNIPREDPGKRRI